MIIDGHEMTASQSEREIYDGCIALMQELMGLFEDYLDFIGLPTPEEISEEESFATYFYPTQIVERLFLWNTRHSGGTSQHLKCKELGIDSSKPVIFKDKRGTE